MIVFVYGTLKRGFSNYHHLANSDFLGKAKLKIADHSLFDVGPFPVILETRGNSSTIAGELFEITPGVLQALDRLEGGLYFRKTMIISSGRRRYSSQVYIGVRDVWDRRSLKVCPIKDGVTSWEGRRN